MKLSDWFSSKKKNKTSSRLSDSSALSESTIGDSEKQKFNDVWSDSAALRTLLPKKLKRL